MSYARWDRDFWDGAVREAIGRDREAYEVWHWLVASKSASSVGVFRPSLRNLATQAFLDGPDEAKAAVDRLARLIPGSLRVLDGWVWLVKCAAKQHSAVKSDADRVKRGAELREDIATAKDSPFWPEFFETYREHLCLRASEGHPKMPEGHQDGHPRRTEGHPGLQDGHPGTSDGHPTTQDGHPTPSPAQPCPALPSPALPSPAREQPQSYRTDDRDPWPEEAASQALDAYQAELERVALVPQGDPLEPFERAAIYLRDRMNHDPATIPATLAAIVALAAKDPAFRAHPKHGDLFLRPNALMGRRIGSADNLGVDVKIPEWLNRLAQARPKPRPSTHVDGSEGEPRRPPTEEERAEIERILERGRLMLAEKRQALATSKPA